MHGRRNLKRELRRGRPEPQREFIDSLLATVGRQPTRPTSSFRPRLALGVIVVLTVTSALLGGYSYAATAVQSSAKVVSHIVSTATPSKGSASSTINANLIASNTRSSTAVYKPHLTASCTFTKKPGDENDSHDDGDDVWLVTVTGTSDDSNPSHVIHASFQPSGSGSTPGAASWTINATLHPHRPTSVTVTQTNSAGTGSVSVACTLGGGGGNAPHLTAKCTFHKKKHQSNQWVVTATGTSDDHTHSHTISAIFNPTGSGSTGGASHWSISALVNQQPSSVTVSQTNSNGTGTVSVACTKAGKHHHDDDDDDD